jgi:transposase InsO family protein
VLHTDFTELRFAGGTQKAYLMPIIGHVSKLAFGWAVGESANRTLALNAWREAGETIRQLNIDPAGMVMHQDQDPVYTSYAWTGRLLLRDHLQLSCSLDGARGNTEMEAFISRFKNENRSLLLDAPTIEALKRVVDVRMRYYNEVRRHSALDNQPPRKWLESWPNDVEKEQLL